MISHLRHMAIFASVVDEGSFRGAAKSFGIAPSRISQTVSDLEDFLGTTLLHRTTRKISLTNEGSLFYASARDMLRGAEEGMNKLNAMIAQPIGRLKVALPAFLATSSLSSGIAEFIKTHTQVSVSVFCSDKPVDLIESGFDLSVRAGWLDDSSMISKKLGESPRALVASVDYVKGRGMPKHASELADWDWVHYAQRSEIAEIFSPQGDLVKVTGKSQIKVDNVDAVAHFVRQNLGVTILPWHLAEAGIQSGEFVQILPEWTLRPLGYFAVWPDTSRCENLTLLFVRFLAAYQEANG